MALGTSQTFARFASGRPQWEDACRLRAALRPLDPALGRRREPATRVDVAAASPRWEECRRRDDAERFRDGRLLAADFVVRRRSVGPQPAAGGSCRRITLLRLRKLRLRPCPPPPARGASLPGRAPAPASRSVSVYSFAAAAPAPGSCAPALRRSIARPRSDSALASQRCAGASFGQHAAGRVLRVAGRADAAFTAKGEARDLLVVEGCAVRTEVYGRGPWFAFVMTSTRRHQGPGLRRAPGFRSAVQ